MIGDNKTEFSAIGFEQAHKDGTDMAVIAVRAAYDIHGSELQLCARQELVLVDQYEGDPHKTGLVRVSDLVPYRPNTDVTMIASSYPAPTDRPEDGWLSGLRVNADGVLVRVQNPHQWIRRAGKWLRKLEAKANQVRLGYENAASDALENELTGAIPFHNPIGVRRRNPALVSKEAYPVPQILPPNAMLEGPDSDIPFEGFAPLPPFWRSRQQFAGTYDDAWTENRHPHLPKDFDYRFYQCAHPKMIQKGYLRGDERIEAARVVKGGGNIIFSLPKVQPIAHYQWTDERNTMQKLNLDGVHLNFLSAQPRVEITWRGWLPICPAFFKIDVFVCDLADARYEGLPFAGYQGLEEGTA